MKLYTDLVLRSPPQLGPIGHPTPCDAQLEGLRKLLSGSDPQASPGAAEIPDQAGRQVERVLEWV